MFSAGGRMRTFGSFESWSRSAEFAPQVGTAANGTSGNCSARAVKIEIPLTAHGLTIVTEPASEFVNRRKGGSPKNCSGTTLAFMPDHCRM
jgi:hypothetical protein